MRQHNAPAQASFVQGAVNMVIALGTATFGGFSSPANATPRLSTTLDCEGATRLVEQVKFEALEALPPRSRVMLRTFGDDARQRLGAAIQLQLVAMEHGVIRVIARKPPIEPDREFTIRQNEYGVEFILAPGPGCPAS